MQEQINTILKALKAGKVTKKEAFDTIDIINILHGKSVFKDKKEK